MEIQAIFMIYLPTGWTNELGQIPFPAGLRMAVLGKFKGNGRNSL